MVWYAVPVLILETLVRLISALGKRAGANPHGILVSGPLGFHKEPMVVSQLLAAERELSRRQPRPQVVCRSTRNRGPVQRYGGLAAQIPPTSRRCAFLLFARWTGLAMIDVVRFRRDGLSKDENGVWRVMLYRQLSAAISSAPGCSGIVRLAIQQTLDGPSQFSQRERLVEQRKSTGPMALQP